MAAENHLLGLLDASALALLKPHMRTISVEHGELLHGSTSEIEFAYFPRSCIISVLASTDQGATAETSIVGREGMIGSSTIHGINDVVCRLGRAGRRRSRPHPCRGSSSRRPGERQLPEGRRAVRSLSARAVAAIDRLPGAAPGGESRCALAHAVQETAGQQRYPSDPGVLRADARGSAHHHQSGRAHPGRMPASFRSAAAAFPSSTPRACTPSPATVTSASRSGTRNCWARSIRAISVLMNQNRSSQNAIKFLPAPGTKLPRLCWRLAVKSDTRHFNAITPRPATWSNPMQAQCSQATCRAHCRG